MSCLCMLRRASENLRIVRATEESRPRGRCLGQETPSFYRSCACRSTIVMVVGETSLPSSGQLIGESIHYHRHGHHHHHREHRTTVVISLPPSWSSGNIIWTSLFGSTIRVQGAFLSPSSGAGPVVTYNHLQPCET